MFFFDLDSTFRILAVLDLEWQNNDTPVMSRPYHALSLRFRGNAVIEDGQQIGRASCRERV